MTTLYRLHSRLSSVCPMMVQPEQSPEGRSADPPGAASAPGPSVRIGELSRRTGVRAETIRAWERRYDLVQPARSTGGFRLYSPADEDRVHAMRALLAEGVAAAEAAKQARSARGRPPPPCARQTPRRIAFARRWRRTTRKRRTPFSIERWARSHSTSSPAPSCCRRWRRSAAAGPRARRRSPRSTSPHRSVRGRLLAISRGWGSGMGPLALLACPPGELHDIGLIAFGLSLRGRGWRIVYLGQDTPLDTLAADRASAGACRRRDERRDSPSISHQPFPGSPRCRPSPPCGSAAAGPARSCSPGPARIFWGAANGGRSPSGRGFELLLAALETAGSSPIGRRPPWAPGAARSASTTAWVPPTIPPRPREPSLSIREYSAHPGGRNDLRRARKTPPFSDPAFFAAGPALRPREPSLYSGILGTPWRPQRPEAGS